jgi:hypothetical protein
MTTHVAAHASAWQVVVPFLGRHALRLLVIVVIGGPLIGLGARRRGERPGQASGDAVAARLRWMLQVRYAVAGVVLAGTWVWHENQPPWEHAARVLVVMLVLGPVVRWIRRRVTAGSPGRGGRGFPVRTWIIAKLTLVAVGLGVEWLLELWISRSTAAIIVAAGMAVAVALGGPWLHGRHSIRRRDRSLAVTGLDSPSLLEDVPRP